MKATQFIQESGFKEAKRILNEAPEHTQYFIPCLDGEIYFSQRGDGKWFRWSNGYNKWLEYFGKCNPLDLVYSLLELKHAVDALELIESYKGIEGAREYLKRWFKLHSGLKKYQKTRSYITVQLDALQKAIQVWESIYAK